MESAGESLATVAHLNHFTGVPCNSLTRDRENSRDCDPAFMKDQPPMAKAYQGSPPELPMQHAISKRSCVLVRPNYMEESLSLP